MMWSYICDERVISKTTQIANTLARCYPVRYLMGQDAPRFTDWGPEGYYELFNLAYRKPLAQNKCSTIHVIKSGTPKCFAMLHQPT